MKILVPSSDEVWEIWSIIYANDTLGQKYYKGISIFDKYGRSRSEPLSIFLKRQKIVTLNKIYRDLENLKNE